MAAQKRKRKAQGKKRSSARRPAPSRLSPAVMVIGVIVVAVIVVAAIALLDQGRAALTDGAGAGALDKTMGAENAPVLVMEYADYQCPYCKQFAEGPEQQLKADYVESGQVRFAFRNFAFIGDESVWAAEAAECAEDQGRFWDYHDKLFAEQGAENSGAFAIDRLKQFAADLGLDTAQFDECLDSGRYRDQVQAERDEATRRQIDSTPTLLVDGHVVEGGANYAVLRSAIDAALTD